MIVFHLRKCQKIHLDESAWSSLFGGDDNIQSHHKTTDPLKAYFLYLQRWAVQEDQDIPRTGALTPSSPSQRQWRSDWPCIRQQWARTRAAVLPLLWWDDASTWFWWEMTFKAGWWPFGKCLDLRYGINSVVLPVQYLCFHFSLLILSILWVYHLSILLYKQFEIRDEAISSAQQKPKSVGFDSGGKKKHIWILLIGNTCKIVLSYYNPRLGRRFIIVTKVRCQSMPSLSEGVIMRTPMYE